MNTLINDMNKPGFSRKSVLNAITCIEKLLEGNPLYVYAKYNISLDIINENTWGNQAKASSFEPYVDIPRTKTYTEGWEKCTNYQPTYYCMITTQDLGSKYKTYVSIEKSIIQSTGKKFVTKSSEQTGDMIDNPEVWSYFPHVEEIMGDTCTWKDGVVTVNDKEKLSIRLNHLIQDIDRMEEHAAA